jgi:translation initiation factor 1
MANWKKREGIVYSTDPDYAYDYGNNPAEKTLPPGEQHLHVLLDKKQRKGKQVTLVSGFTGNEEDLKILGKRLKTRCGAGGTVKDQEIQIQGDFRDKVMAILTSEGYNVKKSGG